MRCAYYTNLHGHCTQVAPTRPATLAQLESRQTPDVSAAAVQQEGCAAGQSAGTWQATVWTTPVATLQVYPHVEAQSDIADVNVIVKMSTMTSTQQRPPGQSSGPVCRLVETSPRPARSHERSP